MLRGALTSAATRVAGGAAVAAAAVPEVSHARAVQPRSVFPPRSKVPPRGHFRLQSLLLACADYQASCAGRRDSAF